MSEFRGQWDAGSYYYVADSVIAYPGQSLYYRLHEGQTPGAPATDQYNWKKGQEADETAKHNRTPNGRAINIRIVDQLVRAFAIAILTPYREALYAIMQGHASTTNNDYNRGIIYAAQQYFLPVPLVLDLLDQLQPATWHDKNAHPNHNAAGVDNALPFANSALAASLPDFQRRAVLNMQAINTGDGPDFYLGVARAISDVRDDPGPGNPPLITRNLLLQLAWPHGFKLNAWLRRVPS